MTNRNRLTKELWTNVTRLKLLAKSDSPVPFLLEVSPFNDEDDEHTTEQRDEYVIVGRLLPNSKIYGERAYRIELKLTDNYPIEPPEVRFLTPIYHPNVDKDGKFCHQLLNRTSRWKNGTTLVDVVTAIAKHLDEPDIDYSTDHDIGKEYMDQREEFHRKATEMVLQHGLPRN